MANKPKPTFYVAIFVVIAALVGIAIWRFGGGSKKKAKKIDVQEFKKQKEGNAKAEADGTGDPGLTAKTYEWVGNHSMPEVKGASDYSKLGKDRVVKFAINVWAGWAPIVHANGGFAAKKVWKDGNGKPFKVKLVLIDDVVAMRSQFIAGKVHIGWATVDMLPLLLDGLQKDSRTMPRIYQQIDWSNGGDGIVVRDDIKSASDLRGKQVALTRNSPSHFFLLNTLLNAGVQPSEVKMRFTKTAFGAAKAFLGEKSLAGAVSWAPDIYKLEKVKGNKMLVTTGTANKLIADVWFARADFAKDHKPIIEGLVRGIFDSMETLKADEEKKKVAKWMAKGYGIPESETLAMLPDAHWTNYAENKEFFLNQNNPTNFERTYDTALFLYRKIGEVRSPVEFSKLTDVSVLQKLRKESKYAKSKDEYDVQFAPAAATTVSAESPEILTKMVRIHFFPNSHDLNKKVTRMVNGKQKEVLYDPTVNFVIEEIGKLAGQYGAARIVIEGHTDASMKGRVPASMVQELSRNRANAVKEAVLRKFKGLKPNQFSVNGLGWARPADPKDTLNHAKNRRVEVKVYPLEAAGGG